MEGSSIVKKLWVTDSGHPMLTHICEMTGLIIICSFFILEINLGPFGGEI